MWSGTMVTDMTEVTKALIMLAIEKTLLGFGKPIYELVLQKLQKDYHSYLCDCYEHPNYLQAILKELFGESSKLIMRSIAKDLEEFSDTPLVRKFLASIGS